MIENRLRAAFDALTSDCVAPDYLLARVLDDLDEPAELTDTEPRRNASRGILALAAAVLVVVAITWWVSLTSDSDQPAVHATDSGAIERIDNACARFASDFPTASDLGEITARRQAAGLATDALDAQITRLRAIDNAGLDATARTALANAIAQLERAQRYALDLSERTDEAALGLVSGIDLNIASAGHTLAEAGATTCSAAPQLLTNQ